jgi:alpha-methylacyl-CoA racemase
MSGGPLAGFRIVELGGIGPGPFAATMLADMGAEVIRIDRAGAGAAAGDPDPATDLLGRGRRSLRLDLKRSEAVATVLRLVERADGLVEGWRPGVAERLGIGPTVCLGRNPRLVYGRITGWGQEGPSSALPGHDINFISLAGPLSLIGRRGEAPVPPATLLGNFGGGGMLMAFGMVCGLLESGRSGRGQVIDGAVVDGAALLATVFFGLRAAGSWSDQRGTNLADTGTWFYDVYETLDGKYVSFGAVEPKYRAELIRRIGLDVSDAADMKDRVARIVATRTRAEWCELLDGTETCFAPVLSLDEVAAHPHHVARQTFVEVAGVVQPAPAPRFSRTPAGTPAAPPRPGEHTDEVLRDWGFAASEIAHLRRIGAAG